MEYKVITSAQQNEFVRQVKEALADGWQLQGGVTIHSFFYCQAVVKPEPVAVAPKDFTSYVPAENGKPYGEYIAGVKNVTPEMLEPLPDPRGEKPDLAKLAEEEIKRLQEEYKKKHTGPREKVIVSSTTGDPVKRSHKKKVKE